MLPCSLQKTGDPDEFVLQEGLSIGIHEGMGLAPRLALGLRRALAHVCLSMYLADVFPAASLLSFILRIFNAVDI